MDLKSKCNMRTTVSAVVIRADGTVDDIGIISDSRKKITLWRRLKQWLMLRKS